MTTDRRAEAVEARIELNGDDLRREPLVSRRATLSVALAGAGSGIEFNEYLEHDDGALVFQHVCKLGSGASSRSAKIRATSPVARRPGASSRTHHAPAVKHETAEEWGR